jgi:hypothetical protein
VRGSLRRLILVFKKEYKGNIFFFSIEKGFCIRLSYRILYKHHTNIDNLFYKITTPTPISHGRKWLVIGRNYHDSVKAWFQDKWCVRKGTPVKYWKRFGSWKEQKFYYYYYFTFFVFLRYFPPEFLNLNKPAINSLMNFYIFCYDYYNYYKLYCQ